MTSQNLEIYSSPIVGEQLDYYLVDEGNAATDTFELPEFGYNTTFTGKSLEASDKAFEAATGRDGSFYKILNQYNYYDVDDESNSLTPEQRAQVPKINRTRMSQLASAIAEMMHWYLTDSEYGVLNAVEDGIDQGIAGAEGANTQLEVAKTALNSILPGTSSPMDMMNFLSAINNGTFLSAYMPKIGIPSLFDISALSRPAGFIEPDYKFLWDREKIKSKSFYVSGGYLKIGSNVRITGRSETSMKKIFIVNDVDDSISATGDMRYGISKKQFEILLDASKLDPIDAINKYKDFQFTEDQIFSSYVLNIREKVWMPIMATTTWVHGHWGWLSHNGIHRDVKTAVVSYLWGNGFTIGSTVNASGTKLTPKYESVLISYFGDIACAYLNGSNRKMYYTLVAGDKYIDEAKQVKTASSDGKYLVYGLPKSEELYSKYINFIGEVLLRVPVNQAPENIEYCKYYRQRRVDEANLVFGVVGLDKVKFTEYDPSTDHSPLNLSNKKFFSILKFPIHRYADSGTPGGGLTVTDASGNTSSEAPQKAVMPMNRGGRVIFTNGKKSDARPNHMKFLQQLADASGLDSIKVTSSARSFNKQAEVMVNNIYSGNVIRYSGNLKLLSDNIISWKRSGKTKAESYNMACAFINQNPPKPKGHMSNYEYLGAFDLGINSNGGNQGIMKLNMGGRRMGSNGNDNPSSNGEYLASKPLDGSSAKDFVHKVIAPMGGWGGVDNSEPALHLELWNRSSSGVSGNLGDNQNAEPPNVIFNIPQSNELTSIGTVDNIIMLDRRFS